MSSSSSLVMAATANPHKIDRGANVAAPATEMKHSSQQKTKNGTDKKKIQSKDPLPRASLVATRRSSRFCFPVVSDGTLFLSKLSSVEEKHRDDSAQEVELKLRALQGVWRDVSRLEIEAMGVSAPQDVQGLLICDRFLDEQEAGALRDFFHAHLPNEWSMYVYGKKRVGKSGGGGASGDASSGGGGGASRRRGEELASTLQRIDYYDGEMCGEGDVVAEGRTGKEGRDSVRSMDSCHRAVLGLVARRMRWWVGKGHDRQQQETSCPLQGEGSTNKRRKLSRPLESSPLWPTPNQPNALQFTQMAQAELLDSHFDHRGRWGDGIATVAWSSSSTAVADAAGLWTLVMQRGKDTKKFVLGPGAAYVLSGAAQGTTAACQQRKQGHQSCRCCWTHGVTPVPDGSVSKRQSMTIRAFQGDWGREPASQSKVIAAAPLVSSFSSSSTAVPLVRKDSGSHRQLSTAAAAEGGGDGGDDGGDDDADNVRGVGAAAAAAAVAPAEAAAAGGASLGMARVEHEGVLYSVTSIDFQQKEFTCSNAMTYSFLEAPHRHFTKKLKGTTPFRKKWKAQIRENRKMRYLGLHDTEIQAAATYDKCVRVLMETHQVSLDSEAAETNFPRGVLLPG
eukprot:CAMPEP_0171708392 /NCGR_PEP_ID=MMETSP0991-20121206/14912_1 /TAXON_ID=483369 /ORGANISM="non described non described, Strain CCMP2098" /LENGTH=620 /DNA_ID=CAMNT_0012298413 /DNA_START=186 /DNA_END=2048 /DNA_ORIENTATION=+